ncbi:MAG: hypothetical protein HC908_18985 [Calothrix sp. SM1_7_51]|nr:hypothetical protein [Calothrix sp. SM1_7_51]
MKDVLPIARWDSSKYGNYPVMSLEGTLKILYADKELLQQFTDYVNETLTQEAKAKTREKEAELLSKTKFDEYFEQHSHILTNDKTLTALVKAEKYKTALTSARWTVEKHRTFQLRLTTYNELLNQHPELQELVAREKWSFTDVSQDYILNSAISQMQKELKKRQREAAKSNTKSKIPSPPPSPYIQVNIRPLATAFNEFNSA